ncbi:MULTISPECIES: electron transfer flavoprotein subunit alpha/FixB family protein [Fusobacterium]|jgi:electron transfer flavoprotein alpha subunit|uniref:Electron transfer flavoprotein subunit alpha/FixB family protein n=2 Tax=Fusobacterium TaxID=848 RepID=A0A7G9GXN2_9FUSO|nr:MULTISPECIES: electron transfer flavoprotein subunit alpha/FixB family protein [Fusobacterium]QNM14552.1 electron transfer flavoprotein subunit alpha/FixB family protein [Fusobacterium hominis]QNM15564.1 electron transfer flavoprotein subunit alpha/FixB family protein [Fusobacterium hominis]
MNLNDYKGILVFAEQRDGILQNVGLELVGKAKELAQTLEAPVTAVVIGHNIEKLADTLGEYGADKVIVVDQERLAMYDTEAYAQVFKAIIDAKKPEIVLFGATTLGRDLAPRVSSRMDTGLTADCTKLEVNPETKGLEMTRPAFGGNLMATIICPDHRPQMSTVRPGVMQKAPKVEGRKAEVEKFDVKLDTSKMKVKVLEVVKETKNKVDISEAKILVSGGRGIGSAENFAALESVAKELGATVSASRAAVDAGFISHDRQVGQTGKTVRPDIYFACGISGAIQHVAGMEESDYIVAINKDKEAPIFNIADLGIVGDANKIAVQLLEALKKSKEAK